MTLLELGHEIETITGRTLQSTTGEVRSWPSEAVILIANLILIKSHTVLTKLMI